MSPSAKTAPLPLSLLLPLLLLLLPDYIRHAAAVRIEPSGKTKFKKESTNLYLECIIDVEEMNGELKT